LELLRDPVSSASHFFMSGLAVVATLFLVRFAGPDRSRRYSVLVFGLSMIVLYAASGLFHALKLPPDRLRLYQKIDMSAIYLLIAGSCTPIVGLLLRGRFRAVLLTGVWVFAAVGIAALWALPKPDHVVLVITYLGMGWLGMAGIWHYWRATGWWGLLWAAAGAAFYSLGAVVELANWPVLVPGVVRSHELLHLFDMAGTGCHIVFILKYVLPYRAPEPIAAVGEDGEAAGFAVPVEA
jgi:hemolysin III